MRTSEPRLFLVTLEPKNDLYGILASHFMVVEAKSVKAALEAADFPFPASDYKTKKAVPLEFDKRYSF